MLSKNNRKEYFYQQEPKKQRFAIKKLTIGVASVLIGFTFMGIKGSNVQADTLSSNENQISKVAPNSGSRSNQPVSTNSNSNTVNKTADATIGNENSATSDDQSKVSEAAQPNTSTVSSAPALSTTTDNNVDSLANQKTLKVTNQAVPANYNQTLATTNIAQVNNFAEFTNALINKGINEIDLNNDISASTGQTALNSSVLSNELSANSANIFNSSYKGIARTLTIKYLSSFHR